MRSGESGLKSGVTCAKGCWCWVKSHLVPRFVEGRDKVSVPATFSDNMVTPQAWDNNAALRHALLRACTEIDCTTRFQCRPRQKSDPAISMRPGFLYGSRVRRPELVALSDEEVPAALHELWGEVGTSDQSS